MQGVSFTAPLVTDRDEEENPNNGDPLLGSPQPPPGIKGEFWVRAIKSSTIEYQKALEANKLPEDIRILRPEPFRAFMEKQAAIWLVIRLAHASDPSLMAADENDEQYLTYGRHLHATHQLDNSNIRAFL